jgi:hypothetical protein
MGKRFGWFMVFVAVIVVFCFHGQAVAKKRLTGKETPYGL